MISKALPFFTEIPILHEVSEFQYCFNDLSLHYLSCDTVFSEEVWAVQDIPEAIDCEIF
jgi:hypothetical protein